MGKTNNYDKMIESEVLNIDTQTKKLVDLLKELKNNYDVCLFDSAIKNIKGEKNGK